MDALLKLPVRSADPCRFELRAQRDRTHKIAGGPMREMTF